MISLFVEAIVITAVIISVISYLVVVAIAWTKLADSVSGFCMDAWEKFFAYLAIPLTIGAVFMLTIVGLLFLGY